MAKEKRFEKIYSQDLGGVTVWVDKTTGVNYLYVSSGYGGGLSPLLNRDGTPMITPIPRKDP
ncbi:MAG: xylan 1,4-beta-xylosidase [Oscillospiraceae bacterium]|nr:xylan 1,4-beta-xylosidase [Oscillospiraceae bacterium]